jgi:hypothetical protein
MSTDALPLADPALLPDDLTVLKQLVGKRPAEHVLGGVVA